MSTETITRPKDKVRHCPMYNVILVNDDFHSVEYVVKMMRELFACKAEEGIKIAEQVHKTGRAIVRTCPLEVAELKADQIHAYGPDPLVKGCQGSMTAEIEAVPV